MKNAITNMKTVVNTSNNPVGFSLSPSIYGISAYSRNGDVCGPHILTRHTKRVIQGERARNNSPELDTQGECDNGGGTGRAANTNKEGKCLQCKTKATSRHTEGTTVRLVPTGTPWCGFPVGNPVRDLG